MFITKQVAERCTTFVFHSEELPSELNRKSIVQTVP
jgi:hypothetical protein